MGLRALADLLFPLGCVSCGLPGAELCARCDGQIARTGGAGCARCGYPWPLAVARCAECPPGLTCVRHAAAYAGPAVALVLALKDGGRRSSAGVLAALMAEAIPAPRGGVLVPVPAVAARIRARGFNHAELIAAELGRAWNIPVTPALLRRDGPAVRNRGASVSARKTQVRGAFHAPTMAQWPPVILVDDVLTTGATLAACARALRRGGARGIGAAVAARACGASDGGRPGAVARATIRTPHDMDNTAPWRS